MRWSTPSQCQPLPYSSLFYQPQSPASLGCSTIQADTVTIALTFLCLPPSLKFILFSSPEVKGTHSSAGPGSSQPGLSFPSLLYLPQLSQMYLNFSQIRPFLPHPHFWFLLFSLPKISFPKFSLFLHLTSSLILLLLVCFHLHPLSSRPYSSFLKSCPIPGSSQVLSKCSMVRTCSSYNCRWKGDRPQEPLISAQGDPHFLYFLYQELTGNLAVWVSGRFWDRPSLGDSDQHSPKVQKPKEDLPPAPGSQLRAPAGPLSRTVSPGASAEGCGDNWRPKNHKWFESGIGDLNAEPELELAGLGGGVGVRGMVRGGVEGRARQDSETESGRSPRARRVASRQLNLPS